MKYTIITILFLLLFGCASINYNKPFINSDETVKLNVGMSKVDILSEIGKPLYIESGIDTNNTSTLATIWVYEVRTVKVRSTQTTIGEIIPNKYHKDQKHDAPIHNLKLTIIDNKLSSWKSIPISGIGEEEIAANKIKSSGSYFVSPNMAFIASNSIKVSGSDKFSYGGTLGYKFSEKNKIGTELLLGVKAKSLLFTYERLVGKFKFNTGIGPISIEDEYNECWRHYPYCENYIKRYSGIFRFGIGYNIFGKYYINYNIAPLEDKIMLNSISLSR